MRPRSISCGRTSDAKWSTMSDQEIVLNRVEDLMWLLSFKTPAEEATRRVGWTVEAAYRWACRNGHDEMASKLREENTIRVLSRQKESRKKANS